MGKPGTQITVERDRLRVGQIAVSGEYCENEIAMDIGRGLPLADKSVNSIMVGNMDAGFSRAELALFLRECRRVLSADGQLEYLTPAVLETQIHELRSGVETDTGVLVQLASMAGLQPVAAQMPAEADQGHAFGRTRSNAITAAAFGRKKRSHERDERVSILIPAYTATFFRKSLESALSQSYVNTEIVVCDDSGDAQIENIVRECSEPGRVTYYRNERNLGARENYLKCLDVSSGKYVKYLNDDDFLHTRCVARMVDILQRFDDITLVTSRRQLIDGKGAALTDTPPTYPLVKEDSVITGSCAIYLLLQRRINFIGEPTTAMFRREDIDGILPDIMSFAGRKVLANLDVAMWLNLLGRGDLAYLADVLSYFRMHGAQEQQKQSVRELCINAWRQVADDARGLGMLHAANRYGRIRRIGPADESGDTRDSNRPL